MSTYTTSTQRTFQQGYTLVEMLFVIILSVVVTLGAAGLFFTTLVGNSRKTILTTVKNEGDYSIGQVEFLLRNAVALVPDPNAPANPICTNGMTSISFMSSDNNITTLYNNNGRIASKSATAAAPVYLTSTAVTLTGPTFNCVQSSISPSGAYAGGYVNVTFSLSKNAADYVTATPVTETFTTSSQIRNF